MGPSDLVCARCSGRVADAGCPSCRAALADLRAQARAAMQWLVLAVLALLAVLAVGMRAAYA